MRDEMGIKFQTVLFRYAADYEGIVSLENCLAGSTADENNEAPLSVDGCSLVYWVTGAIAGCAVNAPTPTRLTTVNLRSIQPIPKRRWKRRLRAANSFCTGLETRPVSWRISIPW